MSHRRKEEDGLEFGVWSLGFECEKESGEECREKRERGNDSNNDLAC